MYTDTDSLVDIRLALNWNTNTTISHTHEYFAGEANLWRDIFPEKLYQAIIGKPAGYKETIDFKPGELIPVHRDREIHLVNDYQIDTSVIPTLQLPLKPGRFYPKGILNKGFSTIFKDNILPFRCLGYQGNRIIADFNHPLSEVPLSVDVSIETIQPKIKERGGLCTDWIELLISGPGMQSRFNERQTDMISATSFKREDETPDRTFYQTDRMVSHIDAQAQQVLSEYYDKLIRPGGVVLDLMSSWQSHISDTTDIEELHGLGMNQNELTSNPRLNHYTVHDLNESPFLPYPDNKFDTVICSLSVEYLIHPFDVFRDVARVLKNGGRFITTFSNRWFPPKAINVWKELHEFERIALVTEYFLESDLFGSIKTFSTRGYDRPWDDAYFPKLKYSDPVFGVMAEKQ